MELNEDLLLVVVIKINKLLKKGRVNLVLRRVKRRSLIVLAYHYSKQKVEW